MIEENEDDAKDMQLNLLLDHIKEEHSIRKYDIIEHPTLLKDNGIVEELHWYLHNIKKENHNLFFQKSLQNLNDFIDWHNKRISDKNVE